MVAKRFPEDSVAVIKLGGSVLSGPISYQRAARFIAQRRIRNPREKLVVVVSAQNGQTDVLLREAQAISCEPDEAALDLLWSTGELRSVARLVLHLQAEGTSAAALDVRQTGLQIARRGAAVTEIAFDTSQIQNALACKNVAVVPGFLATNDAGAIVTLGRGGSDLTAVLIASGLDASRCELIKDVPGYFTEDPQLHVGARHLRWLSFTEALVMADRGCELVQRKAIEAAEKCGLPLLVRSLVQDAPETCIAEMHVGQARQQQIASARQ